MSTPNPTDDTAAEAGGVAAKRHGTPLLVSGIALMVVGILLAVGATVGLLATGSGLLDAFRADPIEVPGQTRLTLEPAKYSVLQLSDGSSYKLSPGDIEVTGPEGSVTVLESGVTETLDRNGKVYESVAQFQVTTSGSYAITFTSQGPSQVIISQSIGTTLSRSAVWLVLFGFAGLLGLVGLGLLIFGIVRRSMRPDRVSVGTSQAAPVSAAAQAAAAPMAAPVPPVQPPAAWYPDPERPGQQRYWDGSAWTDHRA